MSWIFELELNFPGGNFAHVHNVKPVTFIMAGQVKSRPVLSSLTVINLLKPTDYVKHHQFNIQQLYILPTLYLCVLYLSENKQRLLPLTA